MKIGERGQVTIPKKLREKFGLKPETEVQFEVVNNSIRLRKETAQSEAGAPEGQMPEKLC
ncbi:MAG: AbrB/MazE/SpoVT family DNA-binding domain-containing protein [Terriglobia bacterium]